VSFTKNGLSSRIKDIESNKKLILRTLVVIHLNGLKILFVSNSKRFNFCIKVMQTGVTLSISRMTSLESGYYKCIAKNEAGEVFHLIKVEVGGPPEITTNLESTKPEIGLTLELFCPNKAYPKAKVSWFRDGSIIDLSSPRVTTSTDGETLFVENLAIYDEGKYECKAENSFGEDTHHFEVVVSGKMVIFQNGYVRRRK
jgi:hypothetical protein